MAESNRLAAHSVASALSDGNVLWRVHARGLWDSNVHERTRAGRHYYAGVRVALGIYVLGAALALWRTDAGWPVRAAVAVLWPLGPAAFIATILLLLAASTIAFPAVGALVAAAALLAWWALAT